MAYLEWQQKLETGINVIDGQHKRIVKYINELYEISNKETGKRSATKDLIVKLVDYTLSHFAFEESLLVEASYSGLSDHLNDHLEFSEQIIAFKEKTNNGEEVSVELLELLNGWLFGHILEDDAQYVAEVNDYFNK